MNSPTNQAFRSDTLDWFRGIGILAVIWGHAGLPGLPGAYLFIDSFFVISGFLVSQSLMRSLQLNKDKGVTMPVLNFFANRVRRILIPLAVTVLLTLVAGWFILLPDHLFALAASARATLLLQAHLYALKLGNYFDVVTKSAPLLHAWSLSLEEWFYLITPIIVLPALLWRRQVWLIVLAVAAFLSFLYAQEMSSDPQALGASYSLFSTRLWQFLIGAIAALLWSRPANLSLALNDGLVFAGLASLFVSVLVITDKAPSPGLVTLPVIVGILLVLLVHPRSPRMKAATGSAICRYFGQRLYSLYLAHYPVIVYFDYVIPDQGLTTGAAKFVLGTGIGLLFFRLFEAPMRGWRDIGFVPVLGISAILVMPAVLLSGHILGTGGAPTRLSDPALVAMSARFDINPNRAGCMTPQLTRHGYSCLLGAEDAPFVALFGDSHSDSIAYPLALALAEQGIALRHFWYAECPVIGSGVERLGLFSAPCAGLSHEAHRATLRAPGLVGVIYAARWPWYLNEPDQVNRRAYWRDSTGLPRGFAGMEPFRQQFVAVLAKSAEEFHARGVPVHLLTPVPSLPVDPVRAGVLDLWQGWPWQNAALDPGSVLKTYRQDRQAFDRAIAPLAQSGLVRLLETADALCAPSGCFVERQEGILYYDDNHLNGAGAALVVQRFLASGSLQIRPWRNN